MGLRALGKLAGESRRSLARNLFPGFHERGMNAGEALGALQEQGLGYRRQDFLRDYRESETGYEQATRVRYVGAERIPTEGLLQSRYFGVPDHYSFVYRASGYNEDSGETEVRYFFQHRNTLDKRESMETEAYEWFGAEAEGTSIQGFIPEEIRLVEGYINPAWSNE